MVGRLRCRRGASRVGLVLVAGSLAPGGPARLHMCLWWRPRERACCRAPSLPSSRRAAAALLAAAAAAAAVAAAIAAVLPLAPAPG